MPQLPVPQVLQVFGVPGLPEITAGDDLADIIASALATTTVSPALHDGDIVVVTSKVVSKALGLYADPIVGTDSARRAALVLAESTSVVAERRTPDSITRVVTARSGPVMAGAGIDASNALDERLLLLPHDPDAAARHLHEALTRRTGVRIAVLLSDTSGRAWRTGLTDFALGCSGLIGLEDLRGLADTHGRDLAVTVRNLADEIASAADLVKGKLDRVPVAIVRGLAHLVIPPVPAVRADGSSQGASFARDLIRTGPGDWFALGRAEAVRDALGVPAGSDLSEQVGIESVAPEPLVERVARAVRVTLARESAGVLDDPDDPNDVGEDVGEDVGVDLAGSGERVDLTAVDPVALGRAWARLEVALAGERLTCVSERSADTVTLRISEADGSGE